MKIENKIKYSRVKEALIRWVLGTGGTVLDVIPWGKEIESVIPWKDVCDEISNKKAINGTSSFFNFRKTWFQ